VQLNFLKSFRRKEMPIKKEIDTILQEDDFKPALFKMLSYEGGFNPKETDGGESNYGVKQTTFDSYMKQKGKETKSVKELNAGDVVNFYRDTFWKGSRANEMEEPLRTVYFDGSVNMGVPDAVKQLQKIVGTKVDGKYGKKTEAKVKEFIEKHGAKALAGQVIDKRKDHYDTMVTNNPAKHKKHYQGWLNRINKLRGEYVGDGLIHFPKTDTMRPMAHGLTVPSPEWMRNWQESFPDMGDKIAREQAEGYPSPIMPPSMEQESIPDRGDEIAEEIAQGYPSPVTYDPKPEDLVTHSTGEGKVENLPKIETLWQPSNKTDVPFKGEFTEGKRYIDSIGDDPYIYETQYVDPKTLLDTLNMEGRSYQDVVNMPTTQKYIEWYKQGETPPPIGIVKGWDSGKNISTNRRRIIAAIEAGVDKIPAYIEIGRKSKLSQPTGKKSLKK
jgi:lysozyme family protein